MAAASTTATARTTRTPAPHHRFRGAKFDYLAANVKYAGTNESILPPYAIKNVHGAKIGFIGMTLEATPDIVTASGIAGLEFRDEVETANALVPVLKRKGVNAIVVLIHEGGTPKTVKWADPSGTEWDVTADWDHTCAKGGELKENSPIVPIAEQPRPRDRHGGLRPHPRALRVRGRRPCAATHAC